MNEQERLLKAAVENSQYWEEQYLCLERRIREYFNAKAELKRERKAIRKFVKERL